MNVCPVCESKKVLRFVGEYRICKNCHAMYLYEMPDENHLKKQSESDAVLMTEPSQMYGDENVWTDRLHSILKYIQKPKEFLDVGYGSGKFLLHIKDRGYQPYGIELSKKLLKHAQKNGLIAYPSFEELGREKMDVITLFDVIEHITTPHEFITTITKSLKKEGILMITTPNATGISAKVLKDKWWVFGPGAHFILFSPKSLRMLLTDHGYKVLSVRTDTITQWWRPNDTILRKIGNKLQYELLNAFGSLLFRNNLGDNLQIIAVKK